MLDLSTILDKPITWMKAETDPDLKTFLSELQANILKGHGRHHTANMFLSFAGMTSEKVAEVVRLLGNQCTSAYTQLRTNKKYPPYNDRETVRCMFLSKSGYTALGKFAKIPEGDAFNAGMAARTKILNDPEQSRWSRVGWSSTLPDAMFLIANAYPDLLNADLGVVEGWLNGTGVKILFIERGLQQTRQFRQGEKAEGVEHFGYVDGRSQPLFLTEDLNDEGVPNDPAVPSKRAHWSPEFKPSQFIIKDPNAKSGLAAGSYFVFRKLEQDVRGFNKAEDDLGEAIFGPNATQAQKDQAGAMVVGRFEDGTPLTLSTTALAQAVPNDFTYAGDANGAQCPFHAHIRKTNPRGDIERTLGIEDESGGRKPIMARRGITYGVERPHNADHSEFDDKGREPRHDSGLLFMAYMASIEGQFEFTQKSWANNAEFVHNIGPIKTPLVGVDPVIGQTNNPLEMRHEYFDNTGKKKSLSFEKFVHVQGGEYFFAPSLNFLRAVGL